MRQTEEDVECVVQGNSMALNTFYRIARNTLGIWFPNIGSSSTDAHAANPKEVRYGVLHSNNKITYDFLFHFRWKKLTGN